MRDNLITNISRYATSLPPWELAARQPAGVNPAFICERTFSAPRNLRIPPSHGLPRRVVRGLVQVPVVLDEVARNLNVTAQGRRGDWRGAIVACLWAVRRGRGCSAETATP
eukprot:4743929-Alexandrium_andersonii.AAC.1